jgi:ADP-heptose:LPS heptosyltransferase
MKKLLDLIMRSGVMRYFLNPSFKKISRVGPGKICIVLSEENMLGDLVIHNFIVQQLGLHGYSVYYGVTGAFYRRYKVFFEGHCLARKVFVLPEGRLQRIRFVRAVRKERISAVIIDEYPMMGAFYFYAAGIPVIIGPARQKSVFHSREYMLDKLALHYTAIVGALLDLLGYPPKEKVQHVISPYFPYRKMDIGSLERHGDSSLAIHMGGGNYWNRKWPREKFIEICRLFLKHYNGRLFLVGGEDEFDANEEVRRELIKDCPADERVLNFCGPDLNKTANVIDASEVFIGNDSAPMHVAIALNKKVMGIFGPSAIPVVNPSQYDKRNITIRSNLECVPCLSNQCRLPDENKLSCLTQLPSLLVWDELQRII